MVIGPCGEFCLADGRVFQLFLPTAKNQMGLQRLREAEARDSRLLVLQNACLSSLLELQI